MGSGLWVIDVVIFQKPQKRSNLREHMVSNSHIYGKYPSVPAAASLPIAGRWGGGRHQTFTSWSWAWSCTFTTCWRGQKAQAN